MIPGPYAVHNPGGRLLHEREADVKRIAELDRMIAHGLGNRRARAHYCEWCHDWGSAQWLREHACKRAVRPHRADYESPEARRVAYLKWRGIG